MSLLVDHEKAQSLLFQTKLFRANRVGTSKTQNGMERNGMN